jgi:hypothetical protein
MEANEIPKIVVGVSSFAPTLTLRVFVLKFPETAT